MPKESAVSAGGQFLMTSMDAYEPVTCRESSQPNVQQQSLLCDCSSAWNIHEIVAVLVIAVSVASAQVLACFPLSHHFCVWNDI